MSSELNVRTIVEAWLGDHGYHGLYHPDEGCACQIGDLMPCERWDAEGVEVCRPGMKAECPDPVECEWGDRPGHLHIVDRPAVDGPEGSCD